MAFFKQPIGTFLLIRVRVSSERRESPALRVMEQAYRCDLHELVYDLPGVPGPRA